MKTHLLISFATLVASIGVVSAQSPSKAPVGVPADAQPFNGKWYRAYPGKQTWSAARQKCEQLGGMLAVVHDQQTHAFLVRLANKRAFWLGATNEQSGEWRWLDGKKMTFAAWQPGQPSNFENHEHWLAMGVKGGWFDIDQKSSLVQGFLCEWKK